MFQLETVFFVFILLLVNSTSSHPDFKMYLNTYASAARIVFIYDKCFTIMTLNSSILFTEPEKCVNIHKAVYRVFVFESRKWSFRRRVLRLTAAILAKGNENCAKRETDSNGHEFVASSWSELRFRPAPFCLCLLTHFLSICSAFAQLCWLSFPFIKIEFLWKRMKGWRSEASRRMKKFARKDRKQSRFCVRVLRLPRILVKFKGSKICLSIWIRHDKFG